MDELVYSVISDFHVVQEKFVGLTPYNVIRDCKTLGIKEREYDQISCEIADELASGVGRPSNQDIYIAQNRKASFAKIRIVDIKTNKGKSSGYRCIVLNDKINYIGYLLHIYKHSSGEDNIGNKEREKLKDLVEEYARSLEEKR